MVLVVGPRAAAPTAEAGGGDPMLASSSSIPDLLRSARRSLRTDHLGMPLMLRNRQKFKYARTYTIMYDPEKVCHAPCSVRPARGSGAREL